jgi:putative membrane protein
VAWNDDSAAGDGPTRKSPTGGELASVVQSLERPDRRLALYYLIASVAGGPLYPIFAIASLIRYKTLRYRFDDEGVSMRWGILFRREVSLTYARIQDIHLSSNAVERYLDLGKVLVQTASASAGAEIKIEGFREFEQIRDFLYSRMRGAKGLQPLDGTSADSGRADSIADSGQRSLATVLDELAGELDSLRQELSSRSSLSGAGRSGAEKGSLPE